MAERGVVACYQISKAVESAAGPRLHQMMVFLLFLCFSLEAMNTKNSKERVLV